MELFGFFSTILGQLVGQAPLLMAYLVGLGLAAYYWQRHPQVSALAALASIIFILNAVINIAFNIGLPTLIAESGLRGTELSKLLVSRSICTSLVLTLAWAFVLAAIFGWRAQGQDTDI
jgi:uncharacterized membrane protein (DUF485 family)